MLWLLLFVSFLFADFLQDATARCVHILFCRGKKNVHTPHVCVVDEADLLRRTTLAVSGKHEEFPNRRPGLSKGSARFFLATKQIRDIYNARVWRVCVFCAPAKNAHMPRSSIYQ